MLVALNTVHIYIKIFKRKCFHASGDLGICSMQAENNIRCRVHNRYLITEQKPLCVR